MVLNTVRTSALSLFTTDAATLTMMWQTVLLGMGMVFAVLAILWLILSVFKLIFAVVMVLCALGGRERHRLRTVLVFLGLSFAFSGAIMAVQYEAGGISLGIMLIATGVCYLIFTTVFRRSTTGAMKCEICEVEVRLNGRETVFFALVDSGNTLTEPLTNRPVIVAEFDAVCDILPEAEKGLYTDVTRISELSKSVRAVVIPYKTVSGTDMLVGFTPDEVRVSGRVRRDTVIAICKAEISDGGAYHALVGV